MLMGLLAICLFLTGAPSTKNCPVTTESDTACCTALGTSFFLNIVSAFGNNIKILSWMMSFHTCLLLVMLALYASAKFHSVLGGFVTIVTECGPFCGI